MKQFKFSALCVIAALFASSHAASGQVINASVQNAPSRPAPSRGAPAAKPITGPAIVPHIAPRPTGFVPRTVGQSAPNLLPNYPVVPRSLNPAVGAINAQRIRQSDVRGAITLDPTTRQNELRTLAAMRQRRAVGTENRTLGAINAQRRVMTHDPGTRSQLETHGSPADLTQTKWHHTNDRPSYSDACRRHWHEWHDRNWWHCHCDTIVFVIGGYYFLEGSYWYPAYGYDPLQSYYDYDGPIYTYGNLLPDEVIANVQAILQDAGYYFGAITGSLNFETRTALANFQRDYGLPITGAIDEPTVQTLGLDQSQVYQTGDVSNSSY
jgi:hypothetical protein